LDLVPRYLCLSWVVQWVESGTVAGVGGTLRPSLQREQIVQILEGVDIGVVQRHEEATDANIRLGRYGLPGPQEFTSFKAKLEQDDLYRLFHPQEFHVHTDGDTCKVADLRQTSASHHRVSPFIKGKVDLRLAANLEILIAAVDAQCSPLIIYDGNHRTIAHYLMHGSIHDVPAFICVSSRVWDWGMVPRSARGQPSRVRFQ